MPYSMESPWELSLSKSLMMGFPPGRGGGAGLGAEGTIESNLKESRLSKSKIPLGGAGGFKEVGIIFGDAGT